MARRPINWRFVRDCLAHRRHRRRMADAGFEGPFEVPIWEIHRGVRWRERAVAVELSPDGKSVYFLCEEGAENG